MKGKIISALLCLILIASLVGVPVTVSAEAPVADFTSDVTSGEAPLTVNFADLSTNAIFWLWDFGDGEGSTDQNPAHTYDVGGAYTVSLFVMDGAGGSDQRIKPDYITAEGPLIAAFSADTTSGDAPLTVHFTDLTNKAPTIWAWDFDNNGSVDSTEQNPTHIYTDSGAYTVKLIAGNLEEEDTEIKGSYIHVISQEPPLADFEATIYSGNAPLTVQFLDLSTNLPTSWEWDFDNDGEIDSTDQNPEWTYVLEGHYTVKLTVSNEWGSDEKIEVTYIDVFTPGLDADFSADLQVGYAPLTVHFSDLTTKAPTFWEWDFDNNGSIDSTLQNPAYTYSDPGLYSVKLHAGNEEEEDIEIKGSYIYLVPSESPLADFNFEGNRGSSPLMVQFNDQSTNLPSSWAWDFDNNGTVDSTEQYPWHTYTETGVYTVKLTAANSFGSDAEIKTNCIIVHVPEGPPEAEFAADITSGTAPLTVQFFDLSSVEIQVQWDFGDDSNPSEEFDPVHTYANPGTYTVSLRTVTEEEDEEIKTNYITVLPPPVADFSADVATGPAPLTVHYTDLTTNGPTSWAWDFDNNGSIDSTARHPTHIYNTAGTYAVKLTATSSNGVSDSEIKTGYIHVTLAGAPPWDLNNDHIIDIGDVVVLGLHWAETGAHGWIPQDLNNDGVIDIGDVVVLGLHWAETW